MAMGAALGGIVAGAACALYLLVPQGECPWVYELPGSGWFHLFCTQQSKPGAQTTRAYRSRDPYDVSIGHNRCLVARMPVAAPELVEHEGWLYLAALREGLRGIRIARLRFAAAG